MGGGALPPQRPQVGPEQGGYRPQQLVGVSGMDPFMQSIQAMLASGSLPGGQLPVMQSGAGGFGGVATGAVAPGVGAGGPVATGIMPPGLAAPSPAQTAVPASGGMLSALQSIKGGGQGGQGYPGFGAEGKPERGAGEAPTASGKWEASGPQPGQGGPTATTGAA